MELTESLIRTVMPFAIKARITPFIKDYNRFGLNNYFEKPEQLAMFLAQIAHESGELNFLEEIASGSAYEGRKDLGNVVPGDGKRFKGRGYIQLTGRANYEAFTTWLNQNYPDMKADFIKHPELVSTPDYAFLATVYYWKNHDLKSVTKIIDATLVINGGLNGFGKRKAYYNTALNYFKYEKP